jgi:hypothetical protein
MSNNKLKLENIIHDLNEDTVSTDKETLEKIKNYLSSLSSSALNSEPIQALKRFYDNVGLTVKDLLVTSDDMNFYKEVLRCIDAPDTPENIKFLLAWRQAEGAGAKNNPFNTTRKRENSTFYNCLSRNKKGDCNFGVKNYATRQDGIQATCETLKLSAFSSLLKQLRSGKATAYEMANNEEAMRIWGTGKLIAKVVNGYNQGYAPKPKPIAV